MSLAAKQYSLDFDGHEHFRHLHQPAHGVTLLWERSDGANRWHKLRPDDAHIPALLAAQAGQPDRYITPNEFHAWRLVRHLKSLRACYVDVDLKNGQDSQVVLALILSELSIPKPSAVVLSGRGLHLYWFIEPVPSQALPVWQRVQDTLIELLKPYGGDPAARDCARVLRLVGSVNSKNGETVRGVVYDPSPYTFRHLCDEVLGERAARPSAIVRDVNVERARRGQRTRTGSIYDRWHLVYRDLLAIAEHHFLGGVPDGYRDKWLFLSGVALSWFAHPDVMQVELEKQARVWTPGLTMREVRSAIEPSLTRARLAADEQLVKWGDELVDPRYRFRRETLFEWMQGCIPSDLAPQLRAIVSKETKAEHHAEAKRKHEATRDRVAEGRHQTHEKGRTALGEPWVALGISRRTYFRRKAAGTL